MKLVSAMFLSIGIKVIAAIIEFVIQIFLTNSVGVSGYGNYTLFISLVEGLNLVFFSGSIKANTFYLSLPSTSIKKFKKKYILFYVIPILIAIAVEFRLMKNSYGLLLVVALLFYFLAYDRSSVFFSRGEQVLGLIGEYIIGRSVMLIGLMILSRIDGLILLDLYTAQFFVMFIWFVFLVKN